MGSEFDYIMNSLDSLARKQYGEALRILGDGIRSQLESSAEVDGRLLLKHMNTLVSYLEHRLEEDFGFSPDAEIELDQTSKARRCSFCGTEEGQRQLIAGPTALICTDCVKACAALVDEMPSSG
jgi:ClpX C4-type zinc finger protein